MKWLVSGLVLCLTISLSLNLYLLREQAANEPVARFVSSLFDEKPTTKVEQSESVTQAVSSRSGNDEPFLPDDTQGDVDDGSDSSNLQARKAREIFQAGEHDRALTLTQDALRYNATDTEFLILEADILATSSSASDSILNYFSLLAYPLTERQHAYVKSRIEKLSAHHIKQLRQLASWDILSQFVEPLWQQSPNNDTYTTALAEAYAHQNLQAPMENVLASLAPGSKEVARIRAIISNQTQQPLLSQDTASSVSHSSEMAIPLRRYQDHLIASAMMGNSSVNLMLDTGASTTVLKQETFERLNLNNRAQLMGQYQINTAGGKVMAPVYKLPHMQLSSFVVRDIAVVVLPLDDFNYADGLLGMNFLREFDFKLDQQNAQLLLK